MQVLPEKEKDKSGEQYESDWLGFFFCFFFFFGNVTGNLQWILKKEEAHIWLKSWLCHCSSPPGCVILFKNVQQCMMLGLTEVPELWCEHRTKTTWKDLEDEVRSNWSDYYVFVKLSRVYESPGELWKCKYWFRSSGLMTSSLHF